MFTESKAGCWRLLESDPKYLLFDSEAHANLCKNSENVGSPAHSCSITTAGYRRRGFAEHSSLDEVARSVHEKYSHQLCEWLMVTHLYPNLKIIRDFYTRSSKIRVSVPHSALGEVNVWQSNSDDDSTHSSKVWRVCGPRFPDFMLTLWFLKYLKGTTFQKLPLAAYLTFNNISAPWHGVQMSHRLVLPHLSPSLPLPPGSLCSSPSDPQLGPCMVASVLIWDATSPESTGLLYHFLHGSLIGNPFPTHPVWNNLFPFLSLSIFLPCKICHHLLTQNLLVCVSVILMRIKTLCCLLLYPQQCLAGGWHSEDRCVCWIDE